MVFNNYKLENYVFRHLLAIVRFSLKVARIKNYISMHAHTRYMYMFDPRNNLL
jgi:hypothetical protein